MKTSLKQTLSKLLLSLLFCALTACFSQKNTLFNRNLQNLTAHYNILYNANLLLAESEEDMRLAYKDNYDHLIPVYQEPNDALSQPQVPKLDEALIKANKIINQKTQSHYIGDAYFIIAKANYLKSNFFNALGFFDYVYEKYRKQDDLGQASLAWKARSLIQLELLDEAQATLDSALKYINLKKRSAADIYAIRAQMHIYKNQNEEAATSLLKALKLLSNRRLDRIRWTYLLAQLQQQAGKTNLAYTNYTKTVHSNSDFIMAFNANLNRISIEAEENGAKVDRVARLKKLLKDDNNVELIDQIYYHIGKVYEEEKDVNNAIKSYQTSAHKSTKNQNQKGLSYLKLADIYFNSADYIKSKAYYDSTLSTLSKDNPDYKKIQKKANHIALLANRLSIIAKENLLQKLAQLPEDKQSSQIDSIVTLQIANASSATNTIANSYTDQQTSDNNEDQKFYFSNAAAISQGQSIFKKTWGDRILEDDWRRSQKPNSNTINTNIPINQNHQVNTSGVSSTADSTSLKQFEKQKRALIASIPLTSEQCAISDEKIASAYFDIATHYREVINDPEEAIQNYETLLTLYPNNHHKLATYYNLYRLYESRNPDKSAYYKNLVLTEYPESIFAKTILNPHFNQKVSELESALNLFYDEIYCNYTEKKYDDVIRYTNLAQAKFGLNKLSPQLAYLNALATGHKHTLDVFEAALKQIISDFAGDSLVVPLIQKQLLFINTHRKLFTNRKFALLDNESSPLPFFEEPKIEPITPNNIHVEDKVVITAPVTPSQVIEAPKVPPTPDHSNFFSAEESTEYYFIIDVTESTFNLSSSRFGIGQFNRARYPGGEIKHQLKLLENQNQLIFVGVFPSKDAAADYYNKINPLMSQIMKIPTNKYITFYISRQNFEKLTNREIIDWYIDFFRKTINVK